MNEEVRWRLYLKYGATVKKAQCDGFHAQTRNDFANCLNLLGHQVTTGPFTK